MVRLYLKLVNIQDFSEFDTPAWLKSYNGRMGQKLECSHEVCPQWGRRRKWKLNALVHHALAYLNVKELHCCRQVTTCNSARRNKWQKTVSTLRYHCNRACLKIYLLRFLLTVGCQKSLITSISSSLYVYINIWVCLHM